MEFLWGLLLLVGVLTIFSLPKVLIDLAWERKGKWLKVAEYVNGLCILIAVLAGLYVLLVGVGKLMEERWAAFLVTVGAVTVVISFYIAKSEAERKSNPAQVTPKVAETIVQQYGTALARGCPDGGIARYESHLPCSKDKIKQAFKIFLAFRIEYKSLTKEPAETLLGAVSHLNAFVSEEKANRINNSERSLENEEYWEFTKAMFGLEIRQEMDEFVSEVQGLNADDPLFHQRVYTLAGLEYSPKVEKSYTEMFINGLSGGQSSM